MKLDSQKRLIRDTEALITAMADVRCRLTQLDDDLIGEVKLRGYSANAYNDAGFVAADLERLRTKLKKIPAEVGPACPHCGKPMEDTE